MRDVKELERQVEAAYQNRNLPDEIPPFQSIAIHSIRKVEKFDEDKFVEQIELVDEYNVVFDELGVPLRGIKGFLKKVVIKLVRFYILPIVERQNLYNMVVKDTFHQLDSYAVSNNNTLADYENQIRMLKNEVEELKGMVEELKAGKV